MTLSLMLCTVTFPVVARAMADGDTERARDRVERDVALAACLVLLGAATVVACAPQMIELLFQRGAFTAAGHGGDRGRHACVRPRTARPDRGGRAGPLLLLAGRASWYPLAAMTAGIAATAGIGARAVTPGE